MLHLAVSNILNFAVMLEKEFIQNVGVTIPFILFYNNLKFSSHLKQYLHMLWCHLTMLSHE